MQIPDTYFTRSQWEWIEDSSPLKILQKGRQVGGSHADNYHSVITASCATAKLDVFITTRDEVQARISLEDCKNLADFLQIGAVDPGEMLLEQGHSGSAYVLQFANGRRI